MRERDPPTDVAAVTEELMARKAVSRELGSEPLPIMIAAFIDREFEIGRTLFELRAVVASDEARQEAETFFQTCDP